MPRLGPPVAAIGEENVREAPMYCYRIIYELVGETVYIHGGHPQAARVQTGRFAAG